jgi:BMFP domain-containing protein YqiC
MSQENLQHQVEALANLATAVMSNHQAFDVLTNTNLQLNQTNMELLKKTEALEAKINSMQKPNGRATKPPPPQKKIS